MRKRKMTSEQLLAQPPTMNLRTLADALDISEPVARELHRRGEFERMGIRIKRLGAQHRVITADVWRFLGIQPDALSAPVSADHH